MLITRSTAVAESGPRFATVGSALTDTEVAVYASCDALTADKDAFAIARYVDTLNYAFARLHWDGTQTVYLGVVVAGVVTVIDSEPFSPSAGAFYGLRFLAYDSGVVIASFLNADGVVVEELRGQHAALATGGALASGKAGFADQSTGTGVATRTYKDFYARVPARDAVAFAGRSVQIGTDGNVRENAAGAAYGPVSIETGDLLRLPPSGVEGRTAEVLIVPSRGDFDQLPDSGVDDVSAQAWYRPSFLFLP